MDKSIFLNVLGESPINRIMDFLVVHEEFDYSMKDIAKYSGVGYATLKLLWKSLEKNGIIVNTRLVGKAKMYKLNFNSGVVKSFRVFYWDTVKSQTEELLAKEIVRHR